jgi:hypothetical protein
MTADPAAFVTLADADVPQEYGPDEDEDPRWLALCEELPDIEPLF